MTNWKELITEEMERRGECWESVVHSTLDDHELSVRFDDGYGGSQGRPFTLWTGTRVYFPTVYDGAEWVESVPRNPCDEVTNHVGGQ